MDAGIDEALFAAIVKLVQDRDGPTAASAEARARRCTESLNTILISAATYAIEASRIGISITREEFISAAAGAFEIAAPQPSGVRS